MLINLSDVLLEQHNAIDETVPMEMASCKGPYGDYPILHSEPVHIVVAHVKDKELLIQVDTRLVIQVPCDRCLQEVEQELALHVTRHVDLGVSDAELTEELDESNFIDGYTLDVEQLLNHEILAGWPTKVLCREDCQGICNVCGRNLNEGACDCEDTGLDPRMSMIRDLFNNR